jgi:hypothetical protein
LCNSESWHFGGGGGGGSYYGQYGNAYGGLGGGGGAAGTDGGNDALSYCGPNGIYYARNQEWVNGYAGTGGGGAGGRQNYSESQQPGYVGGCGIVIMQITI